jgi:pimeloyl-ACP methyl ester carboxylesterase
MKTDNILKLPDGRKLSYAEFGNSEGYPVFYFHATPSSRLEPLSIGDDAFSELGFRVICPDRPGMGGSDFQKQRGYSDWPEDVKFLAEAIELDQFSVLGVSGGGGYAAVCAAKIPEKLSKVVIASGSWRIDSGAVTKIGFPMNMMWRVTIHAPILLPIIIKSMTKMMSQAPKAGVDETSSPPNKYLPAADHAVMTQPGRMEINQQIIKEVIKQGTQGPAWDFRLCVREWDFDLSEIKIPLVLFHGEQDRNYPLELVQRVANTLPKAELITCPSDGHLSTYINHIDEIAKALLPD